MAFKTLSTTTTTTTTIFFFFHIISAALASGHPASDKYAVVVDAGSSKSQVHMFQWTDSAQPPLLPSFNHTKGLRLEPGISSFSNDLPSIREYLSKLLTNASQQLPQQSLKNTNIYLMSTAGMRLLEEDQANRVMTQINKLLSNPSFNPFLYSSQENTRILSGEEEGVFSWLTVNYENNKFSNTKLEDTLGVVEMGGASTQITFTTPTSILANKFPVTVAGRTYPLYAHSHLHYGQDYIERLMKQHLIHQNNNSNTHFHPCLVRGDSHTQGDTTFIGTGSSQDCFDLLKVFVSKNEKPWRCHPKSCSIGSTYQPSLPTSMSFHLVGAFKYTFERIHFTNNTHNIFSFSKLKSITDDFCLLTKEEVMQKFPIGYAKYVSLPCMLGNYVQLLLHHSYGFDWDTDQLVNDGDADWTLGALIYEYEKEYRASCNLPPPLIKATRNSQATIHPTPIFIFFFTILSSTNHHFF